MRQFSYLKAIVLSLFSGALYRDVGRSWRGLGFLYLLMVLSLGWLITALSVIGALNMFDRNATMNEIYNGIGELLSPNQPFSVEEQLNRVLMIVDQFPAIEINAGIAKVDAPMPYSIKDPMTNYELAVLDTTGTVTSLRDRQAIFLLNEDKFIVRASAEESQNNKEDERVYYLDDPETVENEGGLNDVLSILGQIPAIAISNGVMRANISESQIIKTRDGTPTLEIRNSNETTTPSGALTVFTPDNLEWNFGEAPGKLAWREFNEDNLKKGIAWSIDESVEIIIVITLILLPFALLFSFLWQLMFALLYSLIALIFSAIFKTGLSYEAILRLTIIAFTPGFIIKTVASVLMIVLQQEMEFMSLALFIVTIGYLFFAVYANKGDKKVAPTVTATDTPSPTPM